MKTLRFIGMALLAIVLCVNFTACSEDDGDETSSINLAGTTWKVVSVSPNDALGIEGANFTFHRDLSLTTSPKVEDFCDRYFVDGNELVLYYSSDYESYIKGTLTINDNTATYTFYEPYSDCDYTVTLTLVSGSISDNNDDSDNDNPSSDGDVYPTDLSGTVWKGAYGYDNLIMEIRIITNSQWKIRFYVEGYESDTDFREYICSYNKATDKFTFHGDYYTAKIKGNTMEVTEANNRCTVITKVQ